MRKILFIFIMTIPILYFGCGQKSGKKINRKAWVERHVPTLNKAEPLSPFSVGNGEFAFTADITGLQTFPEFYENDIPLGTQAQWGWHSITNPENYQLDVAMKDYDTHGRMVSYASNQRSPGAQWLRANPHRLHLGQIGFKILNDNGEEIQLETVSQINQKLNLWEGVLYSSFNVENRKVQVETYAHPDLDQMGATVSSQLFQKGKLAIRFKFPYGSLSWGKQTTDWESPEKHTSKIISQTENSATIKRKLDDDSYFVTIRWNGDAAFENTATHEFVLTPKGGESIQFASHFYKEQMDSPENLASIQSASVSHWKNYWETGGVIDLSGSTDTRANELERRIVLSRYLTRIQCAGSKPPQETGLTFNSWHGKFHLEMHWWHAVHFVFWGQPGLLEKSMGWYYHTMEMARSKAVRQGYDGARWGKMVGPDGRESPSGVGVFLIWQQPHPIYYAEILYRQHQDKATLEKYQSLVEETADFMASFAYWDEQEKRYILGPPLIPAQEIYPAATTINAGFEISYWKFGLETAQKWRERLGLPRVEKWDHVLTHMSKLAVENGFYQNTETAHNTFTDPWHRNDHPTLLGSYGYLGDKDVDVELMSKTLDEVMKSWNWARTWGWDYPLVAMTAARVGKPETAIDALLMDVQKNTYLNNGHNYQDQRLTIYLPGNGGLLTATAMMAAGWDGAPDVHAPGFPQDGTWTVKYEGLSPMP